MRLVRNLSELSQGLAAEGIVVASWHCEWSHLGSWVLEAQRGTAADAYGEALLAGQWDTPGPDVLRVAWDGREKYLTIDSATTPPLASPGPWSRQIEQAFDSSEAATRFVKEHLERWFALGSKTWP